MFVSYFEGVVATLKIRISCIILLLVSLGDDGVGPSVCQQQQFSKDIQSSQAMNPVDCVQ